jgi:hypothetical protein
VLAAPWALGNIATGPFEEDHFAAGWQVLAALRPGIAEEVLRAAVAGTLDLPGGLVHVRRQRHEDSAQRMMAGGDSQC